MIAIIGLGNPGEKYDNTRHNAGFLTIGRLAVKLGTELQESKKKPALMYARTTDYELIVPLTYVNNSGEAVAKVQQKHNVELNDIWVVHDDTEIPFGEFRVKRGGTSGGHNGIKSIDEAIGADYWRIRIGVGRPENRNFDLADYVLSNFTSEEQKTLPSIIDQVTDYLVQSLKDKQIQAITLNGTTKNN
ncbi:MAG: aminoacyl-tRNA hydrolase [Candidatus Berkelbacteria bacterium]|nr:aminoacyl-tRNA hydrolase [Candidatus Berkelbacteria bacterium]